RGPTRVAPAAGEPAPEPHRLQGERYRRFAPGGGVVEGFRAAGTEMKSPGTYRFTVEVRDPTPWVLEDDEGLLRQSWTWTVVVADRDASRRRPVTSGPGR